jgi:DNA-directed RNA polymerase I, II, and III subunit RPABC2
MSYFDEQDGGADGFMSGSGSDSDSESESEVSSVVIQDGGLEEELEEGDELGDELGEELDEEDDQEDDEEQGGGAIDDELEEGEIDEEAEKKAKRTKKVPPKPVYKKAIQEDDEEDDDDDDDGEAYLQKFDRSINENYITDFHPECVLQNYDEILSMIKVIRDRNGIIIDDLHQTIPYLTKYERARILGQRAKQINAGATPFVKVPETVIDGYIIAEMELKEKRIPFIIRRPMPNGGSEYWRVKDLEDISF